MAKIIMTVDGRPFLDIDGEIRNIDQSRDIYEKPVSTYDSPPMYKEYLPGATTTTITIFSNSKRD